MADYSQSLCMKDHIHR